MPQVHQEQYNVTSERLLPFLSKWTIWKHNAEETKKKYIYSAQNIWGIFMNKDIHVNEDYKYTLISTSTKKVRQRKKNPTK